VHSRCDDSAGLESTALSVRGGLTLDGAYGVSERVAAAAEPLPGSSHIMVHLDTDEPEERRSA
jgi:hypothetical protein